MEHEGQAWAVSRVAAWREPALVVLFLALVAMVARRYLPDILLVAGTAALIVTDGRRWKGRIASAVPVTSVRHRTLIAAALLLLATPMSMLPRTSAWLDSAFALIGAVALAIAWGPGADDEPAPTREVVRPPSWALWPLIAVAGAVVELVSLIHQTAPRVDSPAHPSVSTVMQPAFEVWPVRVAAVWVWFLGGWWLLRRVRAWAR